MTVADHARGVHDANRVVEVGTLRALGFRRRSVLIAFLVESVVLAIVGGAVASAWRRSSPSPGSRP